MQVDDIDQMVVRDLSFISVLTNIQRALLFDASIQINRSPCITLLPALNMQPFVEVCSLLRSSLKLPPIFNNSVSRLGFQMSEASSAHQSSGLWCRDRVQISHSNKRVFNSPFGCAAQGWHAFAQVRKRTGNVHDHTPHSYWCRDSFHTRFVS